MIKVGDQKMIKVGDHGRLSDAVHPQGLHGRVAHEPNPMACAVGGAVVELQVSF